MKETEGESFGFGTLLVVGGACVSAWVHHYDQYRKTGNLGSSAGATYAAGTSLITGAMSSGISYGANLGRADKTIFQG